MLILNERIFELLICNPFFCWKGVSNHFLFSYGSAGAAATCPPVSSCSQEWCQPLTNFIARKLIGQTDDINSENTVLFTIYNPELIILFILASSIDWVNNIIRVKATIYNGLMLIVGRCIQLWSQTQNRKMAKCSNNQVLYRKIMVCFEL